MYDHFDVGNFEASVTKYLVTQLSGYDVLFDEADVDYDAIDNWYFVQFMGHDREITTKPPIRHIMVYIMTRGGTAEADMTTMTRLLVNAVKDKLFDLYDVYDDIVIGKLRSVILREFPKESVARQASRGFNRSILVRITYGKVGVAYV